MFKPPGRRFLVFRTFPPARWDCLRYPFRPDTAAEEPVQGGKTLEQWRQTLKAADPSLRWQAAEALGQLGQRQPRLVVRALSQAVGDEDLDVRLQAVAALAFLRQYAEPAVPALGKALQDKDSDLRRQAALALAGVGPAAEETVALLGRTLHDPNANVRLAALAALQAIGPDAARAMDDLLAGLKDKVPSVRRASAARLWPRLSLKPTPSESRPPCPPWPRRCSKRYGSRSVPATRRGGPGSDRATSRSGDCRSGRNRPRVVTSPARHEAALSLGRIGGKAVAELARNLEHADARNGPLPRAAKGVAAPRLPGQARVQGGSRQGCGRHGSGRAIVQAADGLADHRSRPERHSPGPETVAGEQR